MKASKIFVLFTWLLYVYFVLNLIKLGTDSSLLGFLGCLRIELVPTAMRQEAWPQDGLQATGRVCSRLLKGLQVFIVYLLCCLIKRNLLKILFDNLYQEETLYKVELYVKRIREDSWPRNCFVFLVFLWVFCLFFCSRIWWHLKID